MSVWWRKVPASQKAKTLKSIPTVAAKNVKGVFGLCVDAVTHKEELRLEQETTLIASVLSPAEF